MIKLVTIKKELGGQWRVSGQNGDISSPFPTLRSAALFCLRNGYTVERIVFKERRA